MAAEGGALRVFPAHERYHPARESVHVEDALPEGGTLLLMMSGDVEHEVRETHRARQCVVGWFRERRERRVADLDATSLRTLRLLDKTATRRSCLGRQGSASGLPCGQPGGLRDVRRSLRSRR